VVAVAVGSGAQSDGVGEDVALTVGEGVGDGESGGVDGPVVGEGLVGAGLVGDGLGVAPEPRYAIFT
jgi:hypothetical protein